MLGLYVELFPGRGSSWLQEEGMQPPRWPEQQGQLHRGKEEQGSSEGTRWAMLLGVDI